MRVHFNLPRNLHGGSVYCCWPEVSVPNPSTVVRVPTATSANPKTVLKEARTGAGERDGHTTAHGLAEISPRPRPSDSSGAWNPSFHAICPRLSAACRRSQGTPARCHTRPTTCAVPVVQPPVDPAAWSFQVLSGWASCTSLDFSVDRRLHGDSTKQSSQVEPNMERRAGSGLCWSQRIDSARRQTLRIFTLTWCGGFAQTREGFCVMTLLPPTSTCVSCDDQTYHLLSPPVSFVVFHSSGSPFATSSSPTKEPCCFVRSIDCSTSVQHHQHAYHCQREKRTNSDHVVFKIHRDSRHIRHSILTRKRQPSGNHRRIATTLGFLWQQHIQCERECTLTDFAHISHDDGSHQDTPARTFNPQTQEA